MRSLTFGSLFAGIGGVDLGLERAGLVGKWQVEIEPYARRVLAKRFPDAKQWNDVRTFPPEPVDEWRVDVIAGGFPCQDISTAGKKIGIGGKRSGLWAEFYRIIRILRPRIVLVENVSALLIRGLDRVLGDLAELGFDAEWENLPASAFGAQHLRERIFILAHADGFRFGSEEPAECAEQYPIFSSAIQSLERLAVCDLPGRSISLGNEIAFAFERLSEPELGGTANGISSRVDRLKCLGNAVCPQVAEWIGRKILERFDE